MRYYLWTFFFGMKLKDTVIHNSITFFQCQSFYMNNSICPLEYLCMIKLSYQFQTLHDDSCNDDLESVATLLLLEESPYVHAYFQTIWNNS